MCLKFLLESNEENQKLVKTLEAREVVPGPGGQEAMESMGIDVRLGQNGKVKVVGRRGETGQQSQRRAEAERVTRERLTRLDAQSREVGRVLGDVGDDDGDDRGTGPPLDENDFM